MNAQLRRRVQLYIFIITDKIITLGGFAHKLHEHSHNCRNESQHWYLIGICLCVQSLAMTLTFVLRCVLHATCIRFSQCYSIFIDNPCEETFSPPRIIQKRESSLYPQRIIILLVKASDTLVFSSRFFVFHDFENGLVKKFAGLSCE